MNLWIVMLIGLLIAIGLFSIFWLIQYLIDDSGIVDVGWGASVAAIAVFFCGMTEGNVARRWIGAILIFPLVSQNGCKVKNMIKKLIDWTERGLVPDAIVRIGIRNLLRKRLGQIDLRDDVANEQRKNQLIREFCEGPIALAPEKANEQHYEVPAELFELTLGPRRKYSSCYWPEGATTLQDAEEAALQLTCEHAELADGMSILELGCGWGSLSLWMAEQYPNAKLTVVSNSSSQREFIEKAAGERGIDANLRVITCDINDLVLDGEFDRVVSVEMFEHVRNHHQLMNRISKWLTPDGKLFVHIFCHRQFTYKFQDEGSSDWMSRYFFSGGIMPGDDLLPGYQDDLRLESKWCWNGNHYHRTCEAWLANMQKNRGQIMPVLEATYGKRESLRWFNRWRMFYLACSELFGFRNGGEWFVSHYLFENKPLTNDRLTAESPAVSRI